MSSKISPSKNFSYDNNVRTTQSITLNINGGNRNQTNLVTISANEIDRHSTISNQD